jgi:hypothetical protein
VNRVYGNLPIPASLLLLFALLTLSACRALAVGVELPVTPDATEAWPIYANDQRGIHVRYPPDFVFSEDAFASDVTWLDWSVGFFDQQHQQDRVPQTPGIWIHAYPNPEGMSPDQWLARHSSPAPFGTEVDIAPPVHYLWPDEPIQNVGVAGCEGRFFASDAMGLRIAAVLLPHESWMLEVAYGDFGPDDLSSTFSAMLETLELSATAGVENRGPET